MREIENVRAAIEAAVTSPKVATAVAAANTALGAAVQFDVIQGSLAIASMLIGILTALVVLCFWSIKVVREWAAWKADETKRELP